MFKKTGKGHSLGTVSVEAIKEVSELESGKKPGKPVEIKSEVK